MPAQPPHRSFSAKSPPDPRPGPPRKQRHNPSMRDYHRPDEVDAMVQAARKSGRHRVRDATIIIMMYRHGLRTAELVALRWQQVDLKAGYLDSIDTMLVRWFPQRAAVGKLLFHTL